MTDTNESRQVRRAQEREAKADAKILKRTIKIIGDVGPEAISRFTAEIETKFGKGADPIEAAKYIARKMLASEVLDKMVADGLDITGPGVRAGLVRNFDKFKAEAGEANAIEYMKQSDDELSSSFCNADNVVEMLEDMVEGDLVIDNGATHQWFKKKLDDYRDFEIKIDTDEARDKSKMFALVAAVHNYDAIVASRTDNPLSVGVLVNPKARLAFGDLKYITVPSFPDDWKGFKLFRGDGKSRVTDADAKTLAGELAETFPDIRVGYFVGQFGACYTAEAKAEAA
jgi:hypothetical protein